MKVGLIARSEWRGLGVQSRSFFEGYHPDAVLLVEIEGNPLGFDHHPEWFPDARRVVFRRGEWLDPFASVAEFVAEVDVVFSAETLYDWAGLTRGHAATVVQGNPELYRHWQMDIPEPTRWWWPTPWDTEQRPPGRVVPVPIPPWIDQAFPLHDAPGTPDDRLRVLHVIGHRAAGDRNGSGIVQEAIRHVTEPMVLTITSQDGDAHRIPSTPLVEVRQVAHTEYPAGLYAGQDVLALPRRYGGLCLPAIEAMAAGLAVVMSQCSPQDGGFWPVMPVGGTQSQRQTPGGRIITTNVEPHTLAHALNTLARDREGLACWQGRSAAWADRNTWAELRPGYVAEFADVLA